MTRTLSLNARARIGMTAAILALATLGTPSAAAAQWSTVSDQFYLPGPFNWEFRRNYPAADRLFNAFDYGHAILYERLTGRKLRLAIAGYHPGPVEDGEAQVPYVMAVKEFQRDHQKSGGLLGKNSRIKCDGSITDDTKKLIKEQEPTMVVISRSRKISTTASPTHSGLVATSAALLTTEV